MIDHTQAQRAQSCGAQTQGASMTFLAEAQSLFDRMAKAYLAADAFA